MKITKNVSLNTSEILTILVIIAILAALLFPSVQQTRNSGRRERFRNQMKAIGLALHQYQNAHGYLPPVVLRDAEGTPNHSWRALLLPQLEPYLRVKDRRYDYKFEEAWNSPHNQKFASHNPNFYRQIIIKDDDTTQTSKLVAIKGKNTYWSPSEEYHPLIAGNDQEKRIVLMAIPGLKDFWNKPSDLTFDELLKLIEADAFAKYGTTVLFDNGEVTWLAPEEINPASMRNLLRRPTVQIE